MSMDDVTGRYVRVLTYGKALDEIEAEILQAIEDGGRVLMNTAEGLSDSGMTSRNRDAAIAEWAQGLASQHGLEWQRVGHDVLFTSRR